MQKKISSILIKPAGPDCNMACGYCYYLEKSSMFPALGGHRMSDEVLEATIAQTMAQGGDTVAFGWQGGEPTLMGLSFFRRAVALQIRHGMGMTVSNGLQTNGLLIDGEWADFLSKFKFLVGLSIDGDGHIHDRNRRRKNGGGTFRGVLESARRLLRAGVAVNSLSVVDGYSAGYPDETYGFLKDTGITHMQFIPYVMHGEGRFEYVPADKYGEFLCRVFGLWLSDFREGVPTVSVRFFDSVFYNFVGLEPPECTLVQTCGNYLLVEHNGDVFPCDFYVRPDRRLGNVMSGNLSKMLNSQAQTEFGLLKGDLPHECMGCEWLTYCNCGCPRERLPDGKGQNKNRLCTAYKMFFGHAGKTLKIMAGRWKEANTLKGVGG